MTKILITGITQTHTNDPDRSPTTKFTSIPGILAAVLTNMGYEVQHRATHEDEDLSQFYRIFAFTYPKPMNEAVFRGFLSACRQPQTIVALDDWAYRDAIMPMQVRPILGCWAEWGDKSKRGEGFTDALSWYPGAFIELEGVKAYPGKTRKWLHAAFPQASHDWASVACKSWPVERYGAPGMPRILERDLTLKMQGFVGVLAAPYSHIGSGWWRVRYEHAMQTGCVLGAQRGELHGITTVPRDIELMSHNEIESLRGAQAMFLASDPIHEMKKLSKIINL